MINDNDHHQQLPSQGEHNAVTPTALVVPGHHEVVASANSPIDPPAIKENVRATLSPLPGPLGRSSISAESGRSSFDMSRRSYDVRRSMDASRNFRRPSYETRRSFSGNRQENRSKSRTGDRSPLSAKPQDSSESATNSFDPGTESSAAVQSIDESNASASQILSRSDVFRAPALHPLGVIATDKADSAAKLSQDTTRSSGGGKVHLRSTNPSHPKHRVSPGNNHSPLGTPDVEDETDAQQTGARLSTSSSALQDIASYPLQKASGIAGFLRTRSKRMGNLLATESMGYYEKVSGMLAGGRKHYNTADGLEPNDRVHGLEEDEDAVKAAEHFREHFAFPESEQLQSSFFASMQRVIPNYGKIYISGRYFCFRSLMPTSKAKVCFPVLNLQNLAKYLRSSYPCEI